jgi:hypothetical protein
LIQHQFALPYCWGGHIILDYDQSGVRSEMRDELAAMRAAGLQTLRLFLVNEHGGDPSHGAISSSEGRLPEPYRTNFADFLTDIRKSGFLQVTLDFMPWGTNDPTGAFSDGKAYNRAYMDENWRFIRDVRELLAQYGPPSHVDLVGEGAPNDYLADQAEDYIAHVYASYVDAFGSADVTVSAIAKGESTAGNTSDDTVRMQHLIAALRASGKPMPAYFDVHPTWDARLVQDLRAVDAVLTENGISAPLVVDEEKYNDPEVAAAIADFNRTSPRKVVEVMEWPFYVDGGVGTVQPNCPHPPYRIDAYPKALQGSAPPLTLTGTVRRGRPSLTTAFGDPVSALEAGTYRLTIEVRLGVWVKGFTSADQRGGTGQLRLSFVPELLIAEFLKSRKWGDPKYLPLKEQYFDILVAILWRGKDTPVAEQRFLAAFPDEVEHVWSRCGTAEIAWQRKASSMRPGWSSRIAGSISRPGHSPGRSVVKRWMYPEKMQACGRFSTSSRKTCHAGTCAPTARATTL